MCAVHLYSGQGRKIEAVLAAPPNLRIAGTPITPSALSQWLYWQDCIDAIELAFKEDFCDIYPARNFVPELTSRLSLAQLSDWRYHTLTGSGFSLLKTFGSPMFGGAFTVEVNDHSVAVYEKSLEAGCTLSEAERMLYVESPFLVEESFKHNCCWPYAREIYSVQRSLCRWVFSSLL